MRRSRSVESLLAVIGAALVGGAKLCTPSLGNTSAVAARASLDPRDHLEAAERARVDAALRRGSAWLLAHQDARGAFAPAVRKTTSDVALTAIALWALQCGDSVPPDRAAAATKFLLAHRQPDGGIYDPRVGLATYTSGVVAQALGSMRPAQGSEVADALHAVELYVYRRGTPESFVDTQTATGAPTAQVSESAARILKEKPTLTPEERGALEFLSRGEAQPGARPPVRTRHPEWVRPGPEVGAFTYEDVLPFVYQPLEPEHQIALRAHEALRSFYDVERNPDLTRRYGDAGFQPGTQGLYYYYLVVARALAIRGTPWLETRDGAQHDWVKELTHKLASLQKPDGSWVNVDPTWWEDEPVLVTSYALIALRLARDVPSRPTPR